MDSHPDATAICNQFGDLYTGAVADVLDDMGLEDQILDAEIEPLDREMCVAGIAYPIVGRRNRSVDAEANIRNILEMLGDAPPDSVLMYDANDSEYSHIGELSAMALQEAGSRGAVIDGGIRDASKISEYEFPTFSRRLSPADAVPRWEILEWGTEAVVGGVNVSPGDVVVGDYDGVVVVPHGVEDEVLSAAQQLVDTEDEVRQAIRDGVDPLDAYDEYGEF